jgi:hypothetical protein
MEARLHALIGVAIDGKLHIAKTPTGYRTLHPHQAVGPGTSALWVSAHLGVTPAAGRTHES